MPVYNSRKTVGQAMDSILKQTFKDFEFLIIDDGSTDGSPDIIDLYKDPRIRKIYLDKNSGICTALNIGLLNSRGQYIARMDADDISLPDRLLKQVRFMDADDRLIACGSLAIDSQGKRLGLPIPADYLKAHLLLDCPFIHPSMIFRSELLRANKFFYSDRYIHIEDYELWVRISKNFPMANIPEVLLEYRGSDSQVSTKHRILQKVNAIKLKEDLLSAILNRPLGPFERQIMGLEQNENAIPASVFFLFCKQLFLNNQDYSTEGLRFVAKELYKRNYYFLRFRPSDLYSIVNNKFLSLRQRIRVIFNLISSLT